MYHRISRQILFTGLIILFLVGCTTPAPIASPQTPVPPDNTPTDVIPTATPTILPSPTPAEPTKIPELGLGVPNGSGSWQISLEAVRTADSLKMGSFPNDSTFTANEGYAFLIVDVTMRSLDPTRSMSISLDNVAILDTNHTIHTADGGGWGETSMCAGCVISITKEVGSGSASIFAIIRSGDRFSMNFGSITSTDPFSFIFVVKSEDLNQDWQLQFQDLPLMSFKLGDKASYPLTTETTAQGSSLPQECQADSIQLAQSGSGMLYHEWADDKLTTKFAFANGDPAVDLCTGFAYDSLQVAADGGILLTAGPLRGWSNLYVIEPDSTVTSLVRNALEVRADFLPGTDYVVVSVKSVNKDGKELYLYDRKAGTMTSLYEGRIISYRVFPDGSLFVQKSKEDSFENLEYLGQVGTNELPELKLPEGTNSRDITSDGKHLLYTNYDGDASTLILSNLDGTDETKIMSGETPSGDIILSPDEKYLLIQEQGADYTNKASLYDIATGSSLPITPDSNELEYRFSPDGKWAVAVSTFKREEGDEAVTQKETLYLFDVGNKNVVKEIEGEIVNYFFSPDNAHLSYTLKNEDLTLSISLLKLADLSEQSIGPGLLAGWSINR